MKRSIISAINKSGYTVTKNQPNEKKYPDIEKEFWNFFDLCKPYTMTSVERLYSLYKSVDYLIRNNIPGDFVECGVWKGGNPMLIATMLLKYKITNKKIFLYDTFEGMSNPTTKDVDYKGRQADILMENTHNKEAIESVWCYSSYEEVKTTMQGTGYPSENIIMVKGKVEDTIPVMIPTSICLLRLDTDWYESTYHELKYLYPLLSKNGVLIIDDYGHWAGAREAVDTYLREQNITLPLQRIDYTGRFAIKI